ATIVVTPTYTNAGVTCTGSSKTFTITVNPSTAVNQPASEVLCNGSSTTAVNFAGGVVGTVYSWTNTATSIGLAASGTGDIASFSATNIGSSPVTATIVVTPSFTNAGSTCTGAAKTFTIIVNPSTAVNQPVDQTKCNGTNTTAITFSGGVAGTVYGWTNSDASIGLVARRGSRNGLWLDE
ncbi:MAG: hypothetical protein NTY88_04355, partial [Bacteroidetes bacterium]|nr:hypothetical protein [Bacteroidota bacterium]